MYRISLLLIVILLGMWTMCVMAADAPALPAAPTTGTPAPAPTPDNTPAGTQPTTTEKTPSTTATTPDEAKLGAKVAEQIEKENKLVKDEKLVAKLNAMAAEIAPFTQRPDVVYTCKILDSGEINAFAIPGGIMYFTKGLLSGVESDHELAGVMAHEIAHNSLYHVKKELERQKRSAIIQVLTVILAGATKSETNISAGDMMQLSQLIKMALDSGYSVENEFEADRNGMQYLVKQKHYDPIGLYSVIQYFSLVEHAHGGKPNLGIFKTHPYADERLTAAEGVLRDLGIKDLNVWRVRNFTANVVPATDNATGFTLQMGGKNIITLSAANSGQDAKARLTEAADAINREFRITYLQAFDIQKFVIGNKAALYLRSIPVLEITQADADAANFKSAGQLCQLAVQNLKGAINENEMRHKL
ncbi:MAG: M48 family metalloprotease [Armatimonadota bacterium]